MSDFETRGEMYAYQEGYTNGMIETVMIMCNDALRQVSWEERTKILNYLLSAKKPS